MRDINSIKADIAEVNNKLMELQKELQNNPNYIFDKLNISKDRFGFLFEPVSDFKYVNRTEETRKNMYEITGYEFKYNGRDVFVGLLNDGCTYGRGIVLDGSFYNGYSYFDYKIAENIRCILDKEGLYDMSDKMSSQLFEELFDYINTEDGIDGDLEILAVVLLIHTTEWGC